MNPKTANRGPKHDKHTYTTYPRTRDVKSFFLILEVSPPQGQQRGWQCASALSFAFCAVQDIVEHSMPLCASDDLECEGRLDAQENVQTDQLSVAWRSFHFASDKDEFCVEGRGRRQAAKNLAFTLEQKLETSPQRLSYSPGTLR